MLYPVELRGQPWERQSFCSGSEVASGLYQAWSLQGGDLGLRAWRGLPDGGGRASLGTAAVRVSARWMSWLIPWSGWHDHPGRSPFFYVALQHEPLTKAERSPVLNEALSLCDPPLCELRHARLSCPLTAERHPLRQTRSHCALERPSFGRPLSIL